MACLFISTDLHTGTSGDIVASKELEAIQQLANNEQVIVLDYNQIHPIPNNLRDFPFYIDALTLDKVSHLENILDIRLAHFYGGCYPQTMKYLKSKGIKTTITSMMHNRDISIKEHEDLYGKGKFPFNHITDINLYKLYIGAIREADVVITAGTVPKLLIEKEGAKRVEVIPHGCNIPDESKIIPIPDSNNSFNVGYLGASGPDKGLRYLIEAWSKLDYKDSTLIIGGRGTEQLQPFINRFANTGKFHLKGYVQDVSEFYNGISLYVQPSATEGFGIETIEAISYGRPVIVSNGAGSSDCIRNNTDGFVVPNRDWYEIADKIAALKSHPEELIQMGKNARERSIEYSWDNIKSKYISLWKGLLNE